MLAGFVLFLLAIMVSDFTHRRVPNSLVLLGAAGALLALWPGAQPFGLGWAQALAGGGVAFGALLLVYALGLMGAGDVKFAGALGLWTGLAPLFFIWVVASVLAGLHAAFWLALRRWPVAPRLFLALSSPRIARDGDGERNTATPARKARHVPLAAYLAMATLIWIAGGRGSAPALVASHL